MHSQDDVGRQRLDQRAFEKGNHRREWTARARAWKVFFAALLLASTARAEDPAGSEEWRVWLEPKFMHAAVTSPIPDAEKTELAAGTRDQKGDVYFLKQQFEDLHIGWEAFVAKARTNANTELATLQPEYVRDKKKVIQYATLSAHEPIVATAVFGTKLLGLFKNTIGDKLLVVVPSRYKAFIFPRLASSYEEFAPQVFAAYRATASPVSMEVFEVSAAGWKAVGVFEE